MQIKTPSRLHITLIDLNGSYGRIDGGIGLTLADPGFILEAVPGDTQTTIEFAKTAGGSKEERTACQTKLLAAAEKAAAHYAPGTGYHLTVHQLYPSHSGLGSGTQMALAAAKLIAELNDRHPQSIELAEITGRGGTSGIGVHAFDHGGFIADGGHSKKEKSSFMPSSVSTAKPACLIGRYHFPDDWGVLLAIPAFGNEFVTLIKETAVLSFVAVVEILRSAQLWNASTFETFAAYTGAAVVYLCFTFPLSKVVAYIEKKLSWEGAI